VERKASAMRVDRRQRRKARIARKVRGTAVRPRVSIQRSTRFTNVQFIDDQKSATLLAVYGRTVEAANKLAQAEAVGKKAAEAALAQGIQQAVFDRSGYRYHGRVKAVAEGLRTGGLAV